MNHIYHRSLELENSIRRRIDKVYDSLIVSKMMRYRYYIIVILSLLLVVEVVPIFIWVGVGPVPSDPLPEDPGVYALLLIGIFGATSLAWMGMAGLIVMERTIHYFSIRTAYYVLIVFPLLVVAEIGLFSIPAVYISPIFPMPVLVIVPIVATILISRIRPPRQHLVVMAIVLWVVITIAGWGWLAVMSDGLDRFAAEERSAASSILGQAYTTCDVPLDPIRYRVVGGGNGNPYVVRGYTWWRIPVGGPMVVSRYGETRCPWTEGVR